MFAVLYGLLHTAAIAQDEPPTDEKAIQKRVTEHWLGVADELAKEYIISPLEKPDKPFTLRENSIFRHTQTVRGDDIGSVYLWKEASGRPAVIGVIFAWSQGGKRWVMHEFHSLHTSGVTLNLPGKKTWTTEQPGLEWKPLPDAGTPDSTSLKRKLQAKTLSRRVSANATDSAKSRWELRLVPTPLYEYSLSDEGVEYGAVFLLCQGTDTELLLLREARKEKDGNSMSWHYAFASFTDYELAVSINEMKVWESPPDPFQKTENHTIGTSWNSVRNQILNSDNMG